MSTNKSALTAMPQFSPGIRGWLQRAGMGLAKLAGYNSAIPNRQYNPANQLGTNPNATYASLQRYRLSLEGEAAIKNTPLAINYIYKRIMYCSAGMSYQANTGDAFLDQEVNAYCTEQWENMGVMCSMQEAYMRVADVFLPQSGDSALQWYRDENGMRLLEITADRIGERYSYALPSKLQNGLDYFAGLIFDRQDLVGYRIYDRYSEATYVNPHEVPAWDIIFFKDDITGGLRGVSKFFSAVQSARQCAEILKFTMDTMQQQSKIAAVVSNNSGGPTHFEYEGPDLSGKIDYVEQYADGAVVKYQFNGDSYQVMKAEHPTTAFLSGLRYLDEQSALALGFPYAFLYSGASTGGAPFRGDFEVAGKEIMRLRNMVHRPRLNKISYVTIMDGVERGRLPRMENIARGDWYFNSLPSVDSFRDDKSDIAQIRAGLTTRDKVIRKNGDGTFAETLKRNTHEAILTAMAVQDANKQLRELGYKETITNADILQNTDNPQQAAQTEQIELPIQNGQQATPPQK